MEIEMVGIFAVKLEVRRNYYAEKAQNRYSPTVVGPIKASPTRHEVTINQYQYFSSSYTEWCRHNMDTVYLQCMQRSG